MDIKLKASLLVLMFVYSGFSKTLAMGRNEGPRLAKKVPLVADYAETLVLMAGLWELVSCAMVLYGVWYTDRSMLLRGCYSLAAFTVLVTLVFYASPFRIYPFMSNLTALCALLLLTHVCEL